MTEENTEAIVHYSLEKSVALIEMDDGKNNLISPTMLHQLNQALDKAEKANAVVILTGTNEVFSAGFDLNILKSGVVNTFKMLIGGFKLSKRLLGFPTPVVIACNGHAVAMGAFLLLSGDYRIGAAGAFKIVANEVEIGLTVPHSAIEICRQRLNPAHLNTSVLLSRQFNPTTAVDAGFLDKVVPEKELRATALEKANQFAALNLQAHQKSKSRMRKDLLKDMSRAIRADKIEFFMMGLKRVFGVRK